MNASDSSGAFVVGIGGSFSFGAIYSGAVSVMYVEDNRGNKGVLVSVGIGLGLPSIGAGVIFLFSWRRTIYDLRGWSVSAGVSGRAGINIGFDVFFDKYGCGGFSITLGVGDSITLIEAHGWAVYSVIIPVKRRPSKSQLTELAYNVYKATYKYRRSKIFYR